MSFAAMVCQRTYKRHLLRCGAAVAAPLPDTLRPHPPAVDEDETEVDCRMSGRLLLLAVTCWRGPRLEVAARGSGVDHSALTQPIAPRSPRQVKVSYYHLRGRRAPLAAEGFGRWGRYIGKGCMRVFPVVLGSSHRDAEGVPGVLGVPSEAWRVFRLGGVYSGGTGLFTGGSFLGSYIGKLEGVPGVGGGVTSGSMRVFRRGG
ncbi:unnamed protein product [Lota lota]